MSKAFLDIDHSLNQARWLSPQANQDAVMLMARQHDLPEIIAQLLVARGIGIDEAQSFLKPTLAKDFPDPFKLAGMEALADYLAAAIQNKRGIGVFGDFDVDGATSTAIMVRFLRHFGIEAPFYIPDRLKEGYGPNVGALENLKDQGADIVIICDCGVTAHDVIAEGKALGLEIVVLDHHEAEEKLPPAEHVIDPKRKDDTSGYDMLAACGVTFLTCVAVNARLKDKGLSSAPMKDYLDIVALGTVCDMVPLLGPNRLFVKHGLVAMATTDNVGLKALLEVGRVEDAPNSYHMGFVLGPRINAGSRVHKSYLGTQLLCTDDAEEAKNIAWTLEDCNKKRKEIQTEMFDHAVRMVEEGQLQDNPVIITGHKDWHSGLSGLVAGGLKEKYGKPAVCITYAPGDDGYLEGRGSGRSVPGINMGAAFIDARNDGFLIKGGGHAMAAGFTVAPDKLDDFSSYLTTHALKQSEGQVSVSETIVDGLLSVHGATVEFVKQLQDYLGPFGQEHDEPLFALANVRLHRVNVVGSNHVSCFISDWEGGSSIKAISFRSVDTPLGDAMLKNAHSPYHVTGYFKINKWQGRESAEFHIHDAAPVLTAQEQLAAS